MCCVVDLKHINDVARSDAFHHSSFVMVPDKSPSSLTWELQLDLPMYPRLNVINVEHHSFVGVWRRQGVDDDTNKVGSFGDVSIPQTWSSVVSVLVVDDFRLARGPGCREVVT